jgi:hypothetical protein
MNLFVTFIVILTAANVPLSSPAVTDELYCRLKGKVFVEEVPGLADFRVYEEESEGFADMLIYETENSLFTDRGGIWYFVKNRGLADFTIYFTDSKSGADFSIYFTTFESMAGCSLQ